MTTTTKVVVAGVVIVGGILAYLMIPKGQSPIEIADSSVKLHFEYDFVVDSPTAIRASDGFKHLKSIDVVDAASGATKQSILVKKGWKLSSFNGQLIITHKDKLGGVFQDVPIDSRTTEIKPINANSKKDFLFEPADHSQFTPAELTGADTCQGDCSSCTQGTCSLYCPSGKCKILLQYK